MIHQNHPGEGHAGFNKPSPYLCGLAYSEADGPGIAWHNSEHVSCPDCQKHPDFGKEAAK